MSQSNAQYPDPTSWHGGEEGGSETTSSGSASPEGRPGAFSPTTSESSASGEVNEVAARASANARPTKARRSLDRTLQQLRRFSIPRKKNAAKEPGLSGACCFSHGSSAADADGRVRAVPRDRRAEADGSTRGRPSPSSEDVVKVKKGGKRALLFTSSRDGSVGKKDRRGDGADSDAPAHRERRDGRPDSLELPTATSTLKGRSSAVPVTITVKCRPVRTECAPSPRTEERGSSRSSSVCSETGERRLRTPESPSAAEGSERVAAMQPYGEASAGRVPRQSVARHVARLEAEGFRPPDASAPRRQGRGDRPHCQGHES